MQSRNVIDSLKAIPGHKWLSYNLQKKKDNSFSVEGISVLLETAMKASIEKRTESSVTKDNFGTTTTLSIRFVLEVRDGKEVIFDSPSSEAEALYTEIKKKIDEFESLPEEKKHNILELERNRSIERLFRLQPANSLNP